MELAREPINEVEELRFHWFESGAPAPAIERRLAALAREWDIERTNKASAASLALAGLALGMFMDRRFLVISALACAVLLQQSARRRRFCAAVGYARAMKSKRSDVSCAA